MDRIFELAFNMNQTSSFIVERVKTILRPLARFINTIDALCIQSAPFLFSPFDTLPLIIPFTIVRFTDNSTV
ncbi:hypothetical protein M378DRAFT_246440 [Amanita muscaria Koide BX008]|uniref:Uncharacterized protein n=1 Tax=Amanita muscaria (strain Koide BX008) TaxID=946122 RepID=A0A0C2TWF2_AMAMK|nr:hypothetical protein M378DRAFT_246440 [Amanita muscaria Koide BX008]